jgi:hypothetical protein
MGQPHCNGCEYTDRSDPLTDTATRLNLLSGGWSGPSGSKLHLLTVGPGWPSRRCVHAQRYRGGNRLLAQEERGHESSVRSQRQPPAITQCGGL